MSARAPYGRARRDVPGGAIVSVDPEGPAARAGLVPGDVVVSADRHPLVDEIEWRWYADGGAVEVGLADGRDVRMTREFGELWGMAFADPLFDDVRTCSNRCEFCFMEQLPPGLRPALYLRDDDFRLSFLQGNFITLTNLSDDDVERIATQALSPLYVSLHGVEADVRARLVRTLKDRALERFDELLGAGIDLHVQVVLVPGANDGEHLERTLAWLAEREGVASVGVVPVGRTRHQTRIARSYEAEEDARAVIGQVRPWQEAFRARDGVTFVQLADEFYLNAGVDVPPSAEYDGYPQFENGIGMVRAFLDEAGEAVAGTSDVTLITGELFAPVLRGLVPRSRVIAVPNRFFGGNVSVTGLLTGADVADAIARDGARGVYAIPDVVLNADGVTLDDMASAHIAERAGAELRVVSSDPAGLAAALSAVPAPPA